MSHAAESGQNILETLCITIYWCVLLYSESWLVSSTFLSELLLSRGYTANKRLKTTLALSLSGQKKQCLRFTYQTKAIEKMQLAQVEMEDFVVSTDLVLYRHLFCCAVLSHVIIIYFQICDKLT